MSGPYIIIDDGRAIRGPFPTVGGSGTNALAGACIELNVLCARVGELERANEALLAERDRLAERHTAAGHGLARMLDATGVGQVRTEHYDLQKLFGLQGDAVTHLEAVLDALSVTHPGGRMTDGGNAERAARAWLAEAKREEEDGVPE